MSTQTVRLLGNGPTERYRTSKAYEAKNVSQSDAAHDRLSAWMKLMTERRFTGVLSLQVNVQDGNLLMIKISYKGRSRMESPEPSDGKFTRNEAQQALTLLLSFATHGGYYGWVGLEVTYEKGNLLTFEELAEEHTR